MNKKRILVTGAAGQIGSELVPALRKRYGNDDVISLFHKTLPENPGKHVIGDANNKTLLEKCITENGVTVVYHLAGVISAKGELNPDLAYQANMGPLKNVLDIARDLKASGTEIKVFWPSSIAAFGPTTPRENTPQRTILEPATMYGVTKVAGELLAQYYYNRYGVDVRSLRYPGVISWKTPPGGGTTDYAVEIFHAAIKGEAYNCFLGPDTMLPMMTMDDAIRGTIELMETDPSKLTVRTSYNFTAISFTPREIAAAIQASVPGFTISYAPDFRQKIADSWPKSIDDSVARRDWGWKHRFGLPEMVADMLTNLKTIL